MGNVVGSGLMNGGQARSTFNNANFGNSMTPGGLLSNNPNLMGYGNHSTGENYVNVKNVGSIGTRH